MSSETRLVAIERALNEDPSPIVECTIDGLKVRVDRKQLLDERDRLRRELARSNGKRPQCATIKLNHG